MSGGEPKLRLNVGIISADKFDDRISSYRPTAQMKTAPFVREQIRIAPNTVASAAVSVSYDMSKLADGLSKIWFEFSLPALLVGTATFVRYMDYVGFFAWSEIRVRYNGATLQYLRPFEHFLYQNFFLDDEEQSSANYLVRGNLTTAQRNTFAVKAQKLKVPLHLLWINLMNSNTLWIQGLASKLQFQVDLEPFARFIQANGVPTLTGGTALSNGAFFSDAQIVGEYLHVTARERANMIRMYQSPHGIRYLMTDVQKHENEVAPATAFNSIWTFKLNNISKPVYAWFFVFRWSEDVSRQMNSAFAQGGRDETNVSGWYAPLATPVPPASGVSTPLIQSIGLKVGNTDLIKTMYVDEIIYEHGARFFKGTRSLAVLAISESNNPTNHNMITGLTDMSTADTPMVTVTFNTSPNGTASIDAYATADIGAGAATHTLRCDVIGFCLDNIDVMNSSIDRPY
ncbi:MAG TPA: hypothetical protein VFC02_24095 [Anaerolineales bacterium]|nr:hypothetical protein [Anaerolineales bacterium]